MGGMIVQTLAIEHPDRLRSMTSVMSSTGEPDFGQASPEASARLFGPAADRPRVCDRHHLAGLRIWGSPGKVDEDAQARFAGEAFDRAFDPAGVARQVMAIVGERRRGRPGSASVRVPTLVLHGTADTLVEPSGGRRTAEPSPAPASWSSRAWATTTRPAYWDAVGRAVTDHAAAADALQATT